MFLSGLKSPVSSQVSLAVETMQAVKLIEFYLIFASSSYKLHKYGSTTQFQYCSEYIEAFKSYGLCESLYKNHRTN